MIDADQTSILYAQRIQILRTTLNIDDEALEQAMKVAGEKTKTEVINEALREFARRRKIRELIRFRGKVAWTGDIDRLRKRKRTR